MLIKNQLGVTTKDPQTTPWSLNALKVLHMFYMPLKNGEAKLYPKLSISPQ
jgi:hypothetical protein